MGAGYFLVWTLLGRGGVFPLGVGLAALEMRQPALSQAVPFASGAVILLADARELTSWKARQLTCCRQALACGQTSVPRLAPDARAAWHHGLRLGLQCGRCCAGLMLVLLVAGVMDLRAMAVVTAAITVERLAPHGDRIARATGLISVTAGLILLARAAGPRLTARRLRHRFDAGQLAGVLHAAAVQRGAEGRGARARHGAVAGAGQRHARVGELRDADVALRVAALWAHAGVSHEEGPALDSRPDADRFRWALGVAVARLRGSAGAARPRPTPRRRHR